MKLRYVIDLMGAEGGKERLAPSHLPYPSDASGKIELSENPTLRFSGIRDRRVSDFWLLVPVKFRCSLEIGKVS